MPDVPAKFVPDGALFADIMRGPDGLAAKDLIRRGDLVIAGARVILAPHSRTGQLAKTIVKRFTSFTPLSMEVVALAPYAYWAHEGNGPEGGRIYPKKRGGILAFKQSGNYNMGSISSGGNLIFAKSVKTSKPIPFLRDALAKVLD